MADDEQSQSLELVPFVSTNQDLQHVDQEQVLSASLLMKIDQSYAPQYRFVQQPMRLLMPLNPMDYQNQLSDPNNPEHVNRLAIVPSPHNELSAEMKPCMNNEIVLWEGGVAQEITNAPEVSQLPYSKRKENWIARCLPRSKGNICDWHYIHLQTDKQFRSLVTAHKFIVHGHLPKRPAKGKKGENATKSSNKTSPSPRHVSGDKFLNRVPVGYYDLTTGGIFRGEIPPTGAHGIGNKTPSAGARRIGNKRKRKDETPDKEMAVALCTAQGTPQQAYILYDFEPKN